MDSDPDTVRFQREAVEDIELPPPAETSGRTFIGPAPAPRQPRRTPSGTRAPSQQAVVVPTEPFAPVETEVISPELVAAAVAAVNRLIETPPAAGGIEPGESFVLEPVALDPGTVALAATESFLPPEPAAPEPAPVIAEEPRVVFHPERLQATDIDLPQPVAMTPELAAAAVEPIRPVTGADFLQPGTLIDDHEILDCVATDAIGALYIGHDAVAQSVSIKVIARGVCRDESSHDRLVQSARAARELDSVHMVEIQGAGRLHDGRVYLVTEPLHGETLASRMARGRMPIDEAMEVLSQVAAAVADAHRAGVVRCDLTVDSVMVRQSEEGLQVKLLQVGLAALSRGSSPERHRGDELGPPSDIHALGLLAQHMLVGTPVDQSVVVSEARPEVPKAVDQLVDSMLADDPRRRPSAAEVQGAARRLAHALYRGGSVELPFKLQAKLWLQKPANRVLLAVQLCLAVAGLASYLFLRDSGGGSDASAAPAPAQTAPTPAPAESKAAAPTPEKKPTEAPKAASAPRSAAPKSAAPAPKSAAPALKATAPAPKSAAPAPKATAPAPKATPPAPKHKPAAPPVAAPKPAAPKPAAPPRATAPAEPSKPAGDRDAPIKDPFGDL